MGTSLTVDRLELADTGQPLRLAELVIAQLQPQLTTLLPLPVEDVARACGISEFHEISSDGMEGGLIQNAEKTHGFILTKAGSRHDRRRFTVAHELGHFLNAFHVAPPGADRLLCTGQHLRTYGKSSDPRLGMEGQANEFAVNILMPTQPLRALSHLWGSPQIKAILDLQAACDVSKEAAARRFVDLHGDPCAVVFSRNGRVRYSVSAGGFPRIQPCNDQPVHRKTLSAIFSGEPGRISEQEEADPHLWLESRDARNWELWEEVLVQQDGYRMTLLIGEESSNEENDELQRRWTPRFR
jgi:hypothetical protein